jgi:hypothetical protein
MHKTNTVFSVTRRVLSLGPRRGELSWLYALLVHTRSFHLFLWLVETIPLATGLLKSSCMTLHSAHQNTLICLTRRNNGHRGVLLACIRKNRNELYVT